MNPHPAQVGQHVEFGARFDELPVPHADVEDHPLRRREQRQRPGDLPLLLQSADDRLRHIQQPQPFPGAIGQGAGHVGDVGCGVALAFDRFQGQQQLLLRRHQLRRVEGEEPLSLLDQDAGGVHPLVLHPPFRFGVDAGHARFVVGDAPGGADAPVQRPPLHLRGAHADVLHRHRIDADRSRRSLVFASVGEDRDVIHAHLVLGRNRRGDGRIHGIAVEQGLALLRGVGAAGRGVKPSVPSPDGQSARQGQGRQARKSPSILHGWSPLPRRRSDRPGLSSPD